MPDKAISDPEFQATRWSLVDVLDQNKPGMDPAPARQRLLELCLRYWYPVYLYLRRSGHRAEVAQAMTARFFDALMQRRGNGAVRGPDGRFRTFLLAELHEFLAGYASRETPDAAVPVDTELPMPSLPQLEARCQREGLAGGSPEMALRRGFARKLPTF